jgi:hypothetical protein
MNMIIMPTESFGLLKIKCAVIKPVQRLVLFVFIIVINSCVSEFVPEISEEKELLVVEGLITDQPGTNTIKLSKSRPLGQKSEASPLNGCMVKISDDMGNTYSLQENEAGTYVTDSTEFKGEIGKFYTLHIGIKDGNNYINYESTPMEMRPVPPVDSIYYEKTVIEEAYANFAGIDGCQIYLDTHDPENSCKYFRWDYSETWMLRLNFSVPNQTCWVSDKSNTIDIKSTAIFEETTIKRHPVSFISNATDRLKIKYSILVNQYSLNEDEYLFWERLQNLTVEVGGLYDIIPASIPSNLRCVENPNEKILGYFSVSAKSSKRIFIKDNFAGIIDPYAGCVTDTVYSDNIPGLNESAWILLTHGCSMPCITFYEITTHRECTDCTFRGTTSKPLFWTDDP